jgi:hypothetical protein
MYWRTEMNCFASQTRSSAKPRCEISPSFDGAFALYGQQSVQVVAPDHKRMKFVLSLLAIVEEGIDEECGHRF